MKSSKSKNLKNSVCEVKNFQCSILQFSNRNALAPFDNYDIKNYLKIENWGLKIGSLIKIMMSLFMHRVNWVSLVQ